MANPFASFLDDFVAKPLGAMVDGVMGFPLTGPTPGPGQPSGQPPDLDRSIAALGQVESGGRYDAVGPRHPRLGRALGKYQVMEANLGPWLSAAGLPLMSPEEFLASPETQDALVRHRFGQYLQRFGDPGRAARAWFAGPSGVDQGSRRDSLGTTVDEYERKFRAALGGQPQPSPITTGAIAPTRRPTMADPNDLRRRTDTELEGIALNTGEAPVTMSSILDSILGPPIPMIRERQQRAGSILEQRERLRAADAAVTRETNRTDAERTAGVAIIQRVQRMRYDNPNVPARTLLNQVLADPDIIKNLGKVPQKEVLPLVNNIIQWTAATPEDALNGLLERSPQFPQPGLEVQTGQPGQPMPGPAVAGSVVGAGAPSGFGQGPIPGPTAQALPSPTQSPYLDNLDPQQRGDLRAAMAADPEGTRTAVGQRLVENSLHPAEDARRLQVGTEELQRMIRRRPDVNRTVADLNAIAEISARLPEGGLAAGLQQRAAQYGLDLSWLGGANQTDVQTLTALVNRVAPTFRQEGSGSMSDFETRSLLNAFPQASQTAAGRATIIKQLQELAAHQERRTGIAEGFWSSNQSLQGTFSKLQEEDRNFSRLMEALRRQGQGPWTDTPHGRFRRTQ